MIQIYVVNLSTRLSQTDAKTMVDAVSYQMTHDAAPAWGRTPPSVSLIPNMKSLPTHGWPMFILDNSDQEGALGYHDETGNRPYGRVFVAPVLDNGGVALYDTNNSVTVASVLSHEVLELWGNPCVNRWAEVYNNTKMSMACLELCDPVEEDMYPVTIDGVKVNVSNFLLPDYFNTQAGAGSKYDFLGSLKQPFTIGNGGYLIIKDRRNQEKQIFGEKKPSEWRLAMKKTSSSRTARIMKKL